MPFKSYKGFLNTAKDAAKDLEQTAERNAQRAVDDPNNTATDEKEVGERSVRSYTAEARKQATEAMSDVEKKTAELMEKAAKARRAVEGKPWPFWKKAFLVVAVTTGLTVALSVMPDTERENQEKQMQADRAWAKYQAKTAEQNSQIILNMQRYNNAMAELRRVPTTYLPPDTPPAVAAIAAVAVEVTVTENTPDSTPETFTTTVGQFYHAVPQARQQIEQEAPRIQHDYDKSIVDDPNSCSNRHCLDPQHHKEFEVNGFDGKAMKFKY